MIFGPNAKYYLSGAVHLSLTEEEVKYLDEPYQARAALGHY